MGCFQHYIGIDYSGAGTPEDRLAGLAVARARPTEAPGQAPEPAALVHPEGRSKRWSRRELHAWLAATLAELDAAGEPALVALDHAFAYPLAAYAALELPPRWDALLEHVGLHWPADAPGARVRELRAAHPALAPAWARWRRRVEVATGAKSVFHFDVPGSVAASTHAGLPWLAQLRAALPAQLWSWPFDGWQPPAGRHVVVEGYPALAARRLAAARAEHGGPDAIQSAQAEGAKASPHELDALALAAWMQHADAAGELGPGARSWFTAPAAELAASAGDEAEALVAEGWILGASLNAARNAPGEAGP